MTSAYWITHSALPEIDETATATDVHHTTTNTIHMTDAWIVAVTCAERNYIDLTHHKTPLSTCSTLSVTDMPFSSEISAFFQSLIAPPPTSSINNSTHSQPHTTYTDS
jgi:hypothetical protein